ncbi:MAG: flagellar biosynthetic protein FliO [Comamonas sp.]|nr:flagellar biosynthetic protein FliO [Comamonas sp.]
MTALPWLLKRWYQRHQTARGVVGVQGHIVSNLVLGPGQRVVTVELEQGTRKTCLVLGVTAQHVSCLHVLGSDEVTAAATAATTTRAEPAFLPEFSQALDAQYQSQATPQQPSAGA